MVAADSEPWSLNRITAMRDVGIKTISSIVQLVLYQQLCEKYDGERWSLSQVPEIQGYLLRHVDQCTSLNGAIHRIMSRLGAEAYIDQQLQSSIEKARVGGPFGLMKARGREGGLVSNVFHLRIAVPSHFALAILGGESLSIFQHHRADSFVLLCYRRVDRRPREKACNIDFTF